MSPSEIRRRALLAAAKVSFSLLAMGCGAADAPPSTPLDQRTGQPSCEPLDALCGGAGSEGVSPVDPAGGASAAGASGGGASSGVGGASSGSPGAGGAPGAGGGVAAGGAPGCGEDTAFPYEAAQVNCCLGVVKTAFPQGLGSPPLTLSAEGTACCRVVLTTRDKQGETPIAGVDPIPWDLAYPCCSFGEPGDDSFSPTCTPWGPPTPPEMQAWLLADRSWLAEVA